MADSAAPPAAAGAGADSVIPPPSLVQADVHDFVAGNEIFVRGRPAVCVRLDYPHVYWQWASDVASGVEDAVELHRSYSATPLLFQVRQDAKRSAHSMQSHGGAGHGHHEHDDGLSSDEDVDEEAEAAARMHKMQLDAAAAAAADGSAAAAAADSASEKPHSDAAGAGAGAGAGTSDAAAIAAGSVGARASLMSMFQRRPERAIFSGVHDAPSVEIVHATAPQSVSIEKCSRSRFSVPHKVSQLTLLQCEDMEVEFFGVISSVELIRCNRCILKCLRSAATYTIDDSESCTIMFPGRQERVMVVSTANSARNVLVAQPGQAPMPLAEGEQAAEEEKEPADIDHEVRFTIDAPASPSENSASPAPVPNESGLSIAGAPVAAPGPAPVDADALPDRSEPSDPDVGTTPLSPSDGSRQLRTTWTAASQVFATHTLAREGPLGYFANNK